MKKNTLFILLAVLALMACSGGDDGGGTGGNEYLNVGNVEALGDQTSVTLIVDASANCEWTITWNELWIRSVSPAKGRGKSSATITFDVNPSSSTARKATLTVSNANSNIIRTVTLTQAASSEYIEISGEATLNFSYHADSRIVPIRSNTQWEVEVTITNGSSDWLQVSPPMGSNDGNITLTTKNNNSNVEQRAKLTIKGAGGITKELTVVQSAAPEPTLTRPQITNESTDGAVVSFTFDSVIPIASCGICYTTEQGYPDHTKDITITAAAATSPVTVTITGLVSGNTYYVYGYIITSAGTSFYSEIATLKTVSRWPSEDDIITPN